MPSQKILSWKSNEDFLDLIWVRRKNRISIVFKSKIN